MEFYKDYHFEKIVERNRLFVHYIVISGFQDDIFDLFVIDIAVTLHRKVVRYTFLCDFFSTSGLFSKECYLFDLSGFIIQLCTHMSKIR